VVSPWRVGTRLDAVAIARGIRGRGNAKNSAYSICAKIKVEVRSSHEGGRRLGAAGGRPNPLLSIVVVIYNDAASFRKLMTSIAPHCCDLIEVVVIDGGSSDQTLECIREFEEMIDYWRSESDWGIYDAMNKGVALATGSFILHLNAGDRLLHVPFSEITECLVHHVDVGCFEVLMSNGVRFRPGNGFMLKIDNTWHHQGTIYRRAAHLGYDLKYPIYADFDLNQRLKLRHARVRIFSTVMSEFSLDGASMIKGTYRERYRIIRKNFGLRYLPIAFARFHLNSLRKRFGRNCMDPRRTTGG
jgi:glycosyltransferase involved in cell wall biosynthesis